MKIEPQPRPAQDWATPEEWFGWADRTNGAFAIHQGAGDHAHMTEGGSLDENAETILRILAGDPMTMAGAAHLSPAGLLQT